MSTASIESPSENNTTRREALTKTVALGGALVTVPEFVDVARAEGGGRIQLITVANVPEDTSIEITAYEDLEITSGVDRTQTVNIEDGDNLVRLDNLGGVADDDDRYHFDVDMDTEDLEETPELESMTVLFPDAPRHPVVPSFWSDLWDSFLVWAAGMVMVGGFIGLISRSFAVSAFVAYMIFLVIAVTTGNPLMMNIVYVTLILIFVFGAFKLYASEVGGGE